MLGAALYWYFQRAKAVVETGPAQDVAAGVREFRGEVLALEQRPADAAAVQEFERGLRLAASGDTAGAIAALSSLAPSHRVPILYNNLGALYVRTGDTVNAGEAYQAALARDTGNATAAAALERLKIEGLPSEHAVSQEIEPNDSAARANLILVDSPVAGTIGTPGDKDDYRFQAPPRPRDRMEIVIESQSNQLRPALRLYDADGRFLEWTKAPATASGLTFVFSPEPGGVYGIQAWGQDDTTGKYTLRIRPQKAYDRFEPNDDIPHAARIEVGQPVAANIMDGGDEDFYVFEATEGGNVAVELENGSESLIPSLTFYDQDRIFKEFGPKGQKGGGQKHSLGVMIMQRYYVQVSGREKSSGGYVLRVHPGSL